LTVLWSLISRHLILLYGYWRLSVDDVRITLAEDRAREGIDTADAVRPADPRNVRVPHRSPWLVPANSTATAVFDSG
jgi:hypothetical protein